MEVIKSVFLTVIGLAAGMGVSGGVFTTLIAVGLIPRFAGKTHTAKHIFLYEEMVVCGTLLGGLISVFFPALRIVYGGKIILGIYGVFAGIFVGCLALAIAEVLDSIPIFARRMRFRHGVGIVILCMAIAKTIGSLLYFYNAFYQ